MSGYAVTYQQVYDYLTATLSQKPFKIKIQAFCFNDSL